MPARYRTAAWWSRGAAAAAELPAALRFPKRDVPQAPSELACLRPRQRLTPRKPPSPAGRRKCEGATGSLATLAPDRSPSHPPQHPHGSRLPTISRGELQVGVGHDTVAVSANRIKKKNPARRRAGLPGRRQLRCGVSLDEFQNLAQRCEFLWVWFRGRQSNIFVAERPTRGSTNSAIFS